MTTGPRWSERHPLPRPSIPYADDDLVPIAVANRERSLIGTRQPEPRAPAVVAPDGVDCAGRHAGRSGASPVVDSRHDVPVTVAEERAAFERDVGCLVGRSVLGVRYWDIRNFGDEPRVWDYGDWHHAVMGVELRTDGGLFTITWTNRFFPYGLEIFPEPIETHLLLGPDGPEGWDADDSIRWRPIIGQSVQHVDVFWEHVEVDPAVRSPDDVQVAPAAAYDGPVGLRLAHARASRSKPIARTKTQAQRPA